MKARAMAWTQSSCRKILLVPDSHSAAARRSLGWRRSDGWGAEGYGEDCLAVFDVMT